jgi:type IV pilus assembly protein PilN
MIRINLLPVKEAQRAAGRQRQMLLVTLCGALAVLVLLVPYGLQARRLSRVSTQITEIRGELAHLDKQTKEVRDLDQKRAELRGKLTVIDELQQKAAPA